MGCCGEAKCTCHNAQCVETSEKQGVLGGPLCGFVGCRKSHLPRSAVSVARKSAHPPPARITAVAPVPYPHNALPWLYATGFACRSTCREATYRRHGRLARSLGFRGVSVPPRIVHLLLTNHYSFCQHGHMSLHRIVYGMYTHLSRSEIRMADPASLSDPITSTGPPTPLPLDSGHN